jgi:uncharacterized membrane protein YgdD (TMEM256/DUF423 family)
MNYRNTLVSGLAFALLGVVLGAFGAHALKDVLTANGYMDVYETAVRYQFYHAFALIVTAILMRQSSTMKISGAALCFVGGNIFFSGSLFALGLTGIKILGAITPIGGLLFICGWAILIVNILRENFK